MLLTNLKQLVFLYKRGKDMKKIIVILIACILLTSACSNKQNEVTKTEEDTVNINTVTIGENKMNYIVFGSGEKNFVIIPGLSIHSVLNSKDAIKEAYKEFENEYTVYLFDRATNIKEGYSIRDMAKDIADAMKELNIENAYIFGASQGGMIAQYLAIDYPELVNKVVLGSTLSKPNETSINVISNWINLAKEKEETKLLESFVDDVYSKNTLDNYRDYLISSNAGITNEEYERFIILASACNTFDCYDELINIKCPVLVLGSYGDKVVTVEASKEIQEKINSDIYLYDDSYGHGVYDEASDYKQRILDFFND